MANRNPIISWYVGSNEEVSKVTSTVSYGVVDADSDSLGISQPTVQNRVKKAEYLLKDLLTGGMTYEKL